MDPGQEKLPLSNRGAALLGNLVISTANYPARVIATNKDNGKVAWETNLHDQPDVQITAAPLAVKDKIIIGAAGGDRGVRDWIAALDGASGKLIWRKYVVPAPGEPGSETWNDQPGDLGDRKSRADVRPHLSPRRQPVHQQHDLVESGQREHELVLPICSRRHVGLR
jgi:outer membrane protein assembly factor BamB